MEDRTLLAITPLSYTFHMDPVTSAQAKDGVRFQFGEPYSPTFRDQFPGYGGYASRWIAESTWNGSKVTSEARASLTTKATTISPDGSVSGEINFDNEFRHTVENGGSASSTANTLYTFRFSSDTHFEIRMEYDIVWGKGGTHEELYRDPDYGGITITGSVLEEPLYINFVAHSDNIPIGNLFNAGGAFENLLPPGVYEISVPTEFVFNGDYSSDSESGIQTGTYEGTIEWQIKQDPVFPDLRSTNINYQVLSQSQIFEHLSNSYVPVGTEFEIAGILENTGKAPASGFSVKLYLSTDSNIDPHGGDIFITNIYAPPILNAESKHSFISNATLPLSLPQSFYGTVYLGFVVDLENLIVESNELNNWNQSPQILGSGTIITTVYHDKRPIRLADPVAVRSTIATNFSTHKDAESYLITNGFQRPTYLPRDNPGSWSRDLIGPVFSRFNGQMMPGDAFRIEAYISRTSAGYQVRVQGDPKGFNPGNLTVVYGEPNPRIWNYGGAWKFYIRWFHYHF